MFTFRFLNKRTFGSQLYNVLKKLDTARNRVQPLKNVYRGLHRSSGCSSIIGQLEKDLHLQVVHRTWEEPPLSMEDLALEYDDFFEVKHLVRLRDLFNARVHYGHKAGCRNEYMNDYLFGSRLDVDIIDLQQTVPLMQDALNFLAHIVFRQGIILFIGRNPQNVALIEKTAKDCGEYSHCRKWLSGLFTNSSNRFHEEIRLPDLCIFLETKGVAFEEHEAVSECAKMCIPTIGIVDSNCDPRLITYPIPGNDDTPSSVQLYCKLFKETILKAKEMQKVIAAEYGRPLVEPRQKKKDVLSEKIVNLERLADEEAEERKPKKTAKDVNWDIIINEDGKVKKNKPSKKSLKDKKKDDEQS